MPAVPVWAAAECVLDAADRKPPFPGELTEGFPGESKALTAVLMVPATAVAIGVLMGAVPARAAAERVLEPRTLPPQRTDGGLPGRVESTNSSTDGASCQQQRWQLVCYWQ